MSLVSWLGCKQATKVITGVGEFLDEQQLTTEEQIKYKLLLLEKLDAFKIVQRIMVSIIMIHWAIWGLNCLVALWVGFFMKDYSLMEQLVKYAQLEMVWMPTFGAVSVYLGGGLPFFNKSSK